mgnify:CR=1 FL=1
MIVVSAAFFYPTGKNRNKKLHLSCVIFLTLNVSIVAEKIMIQVPQTKRFLRSVYWEIYFTKARMCFFALRNHRFGKVKRMVSQGKTCGIAAQYRTFR